MAEIAYAEREAALVAAEQQGPCEGTILNALNNRFGNHFASSNVEGWFQYSKGAPPGKGTVNLDISLSQPAGVSAGRYPLHWWSYVVGYGPTLHIPGGPSSMDSRSTMQFSSTQFTAHIDSAYAYNPIGFGFHIAHDVLGIGGYSPCP